MERVSRQEWVKRVERWASSSLTAREFADEIGCNYQTLQHWKYRLAREQRGGEKACEAKSASERVARTVSFVELTAAAQAPSARIEVELRGGAVRLLVPLDADFTAVARLVDAIAVAA